MTQLPDEVDAKIRHNNRLPESLGRMAMEWARELTDPMNGVEFFTLRLFWYEASRFFDKHFIEFPEAESARQFITAMISATNIRAYGMDDPRTVDDLIAENVALKARIAELEAENAQLRAQIPSPYQTEAPKPPTNYTTSVSGMPTARFILRGKVVWDKDRFPDRDDWRESEKARQLARELEDEMREKKEAEEKARQLEDEMREAEARNLFADAQLKIAQRGGIWGGDNKTPFERSFTRESMKKDIANLLDKVSTLERQLERVTAESSSHLQKAINGDWLTFAEYQHRARETAVYKTSIFDGLNLSDDESRLARLLKLTYTVMGLAGEVGEFANIVKKIERDGGSIDESLDKLVDELGDVVWYVFACADEIGIPLEDIAHHNLNKLAKRKAQKTIHDNGNRTE